MKRREFIREGYLNGNADGGVDGCPYEYSGLDDLEEICVKECKGQSMEHCTECWDKEI